GDITQAGIGDYTGTDDPDFLRRRRNCLRCGATKNKSDSQPAPSHGVSPTAFLDGSKRRIVAFCKAAALRPALPNAPEGRPAGNRTGHGPFRPSSRAR